MYRLPIGLISMVIAGALVGGAARAREAAEVKGELPPQTLPNAYLLNPPQLIPQSLPLPAEQPKLVLASYNVTNLVVPRDPAPSQGTTENALMATVRQFVDPATWAENGGPATMTYFPLGMALVVNQTPENQKKIAALLDSLERLQDVEIAVVVRIVSVSHDVATTFETLADVKDFAVGHGQRPVHGAFLNDRQVRGWMEMFQSDRQTSIMQAPKVTIENGKNSFVSGWEETEGESDSDGLCNSGEILYHRRAGSEPGRTGEGGILFRSGCFRVDYLPVVSADCKYVMLNLDLKYQFAARAGAAPASESTGKGKRILTLHLGPNLVIGDGGTLACRIGTNLVEAFDPKEEQDVYLLVTPRIITPGTAGPASGTSER